MNSKHILFVAIFVFNISATLTAKNLVAIDCHGKTISFEISQDWGISVLQEGLVKKNAILGKKDVQLTATSIEEERLSFSVLDTSLPELKEVEFSFFGNVVNGSIENLQRGNWYIRKYKSNNGGNIYWVCDAVGEAGGFKILFNLAWSEQHEDMQNCFPSIEYELFEIIDSFTAGGGKESKDVEKISKELFNLEKPQGSVVFVKRTFFAGLIRDPQEDKTELKAIFAEASHLAAQDAIKYKGKIGGIRKYWELKKAILKDRFGIDWKTPIELNPGTSFD